MSGEMEELRRQMEEMRKGRDAAEREKRAAERENNALTEENKRLVGEREDAARERAAGPPTPTAAGGGSDGGGSAGGDGQRDSAGGGGFFGAAGGAAPSRRRGGERGITGDPFFVQRLVKHLPMNSKIPLFPRDQARLIPWYRDITSYITDEGLEYTLVEDERVGPVRVITASRQDLFFEHPEGIVNDHARAWEIIRISVAGTDLQERLVSCETVAEAWEVLQSWVLPASSAEKALLEAELANVEYPTGSHPKLFFAKIDTIVNKLRLVGEEKTQEQIIAVIMDRLPSLFRMEKAILTHTKPLTRKYVEKTIGDAYASARRDFIIKQSSASGTPAAPEPPSDPHAFFVGGLQPGRGRGGGGGIRGRGRGLQGNRGFGNGGTGSSGRPQGQMGLGQRWQKRPFQSMGESRQHRPMQQIHQQSARPAMQMKPKHFPPPGHPTWGKGGDYDCGSNAVYPQGESPPPPGAQMGQVYSCERCGRPGHKFDICDARRRFEGNCGCCGQYGHMRRDCMLAMQEKAGRAGHVQPHVNIVAPAESFEGLGEGGGAGWEYTSGEDVPWQGQQEMAPPYDAGPPAENITYYPHQPQPDSSSQQQQQQQYQQQQYQQQQPQQQQQYQQQQYQQQQPQQQQQQQQIGGGAAWSTPAYWNEEGDVLHEGEKLKDEGDYYIHPGDVDTSGLGLLACTFGGSREEEMAELRDRVVRNRLQPHMLSLKPDFTVPAHVFTTLVPPKLRNVPNVSVMVADSASTVNATGNGRLMYNKRAPEPHEAFLVVGDGRQMKVEFFGDLDVVFCSERRKPARVTMKNMAMVTGLQFDLFSLNKAQETHDVHMDYTGTYTLRDRVHFTKFPTGNYITAFRLEPGVPLAPMLAALMRPRPRRTSSAAAAAAPGGVAPPAASAGGAAGLRAPRSRASTSTPVAAATGGNALPAASVGRAAYPCAPPAGAGASSSSLVAAASGSGVPPSASVGGSAGVSALPAGAVTSSSTPEARLPDGSASPPALVEEAVGQSMQPVGVGETSAPVSAAPGGRVTFESLGRTLVNAIMKGVAKAPAPSETGSSSTPAAIVPSGRVSFAAPAEGTAGQHSQPTGRHRISLHGAGEVESFRAGGAQQDGTTAGVAEAPGSGSGPGQTGMEPDLSPMSPSYWDDPPHDPEPPVAPSAPARQYRATPAVTRSKAAVVHRSGVANTGLPGAFALLAAEEEMLRNMNTTHIPDLLPPDALVADMEKPETDADANTGRYRKHFAAAREKEMDGLLAAGTFVELKPGA